MDEPTKEATSQVFSVLLAAFGFALEPLVFAVALAVSLGMAVAVSRNRPSRKRKPFWTVLLGALVCSLVFGMASAQFWPHISPVFAMVIGGLTSTTVLNVYVGVMTRFEDRAEDIADRVINRVLPDASDKETD